MTAATRCGTIPNVQPAAAITLARVPREPSTDRVERAGAGRGHDHQLGQQEGKAHRSPRAARPRPYRVLRVGTAGDRTPVSQDDDGGTVDLRRAGTRPSSQAGQSQSSPECRSVAVCPAAGNSLRNVKLSVEGPRRDSCRTRSSASSVDRRCLPGTDHRSTRCPTPTSGKYWRGPRTRPRTRIGPTACWRSSPLLVGRRGGEALRLGPEHQHRCGRATARSRSGVPELEVLTGRLARSQASTRAGTSPASDKDDQLHSTLRRLTVQMVNWHHRSLALPGA